jgi:dihydropteroate synthase
MQRSGGAKRLKLTDVVRASVARRGVAIMGVCNVTPDSFSDGGRFLGSDRARAHIEALLAEGADIIDIGGESTRPGSKPVPAQEQLARVLDVVRWAAERTCVSIDTTSPEVAAACLDAGASAVNDVSLLAEPELASVAAGSGAALVLSHARAPQESMSGFGGWPLSAYDDIVRDVLGDWERAAEVAMSRGLPRESLVMDPGLGFSKASRHSFELLRRSRELVTAMDARGGVPVLVGASRKSFLTLVDPDAAPADRLGASIAAAVHAARCGVKIVRVHDVRATRQALDMDIVLGTAPGHADRADTPLTSSAEGRD